MLTLRVAKEIKLTQGQVALVDDEDFERLNAFKWHSQWNPHTQSFYAVRNSPKAGGKQLTVRMHREIMGAKSNKQVDHENHNTLDNRKENLRVCTREQNARNGRSRRNNTSGFKGVSWDKRALKWLAHVGAHGKAKHLGYFANPIEAAVAYDAAAVLVHGEFAMTNAMLGLL